MKFESKHSLEDIVYLKTDPDQSERIITAVSFKGNGAIVYSLSMGITESSHYDFEISCQKDLMKQLDIYNSSETK